MKYIKIQMWSDSNYLGKRQKHWAMWKEGREATASHHQLCCCWAAGCDAEGAFSSASVSTALFITAKIRCNRMSISGWVHRENVVYICNKMSIDHKKNEVLICSATWLELDDITVSETSKTETVRYQGFLVTQWHLQSWRHRRDWRPVRVKVRWERN